MTLQYLPDFWKKKIHEIYGSAQPGARDFTQDIQIEFEDGSKALFRYAIKILDESRNEVLLLTEHCGYHVFPWGHGANRFEMVKNEI